MIPSNDFVVSYLVLLNTLAFFLVLVASLLIYRYIKYRSRVYLFSTAFFSCQLIGLLAINTGTIIMDVSPFAIFLDPEHLMFATPALLAILFYLLEIKGKDYMTVKKALLYALPFVVLYLVILCVGGRTELASFDDLPANIANTDIILRLCMAALYPIAAIVAVCTRFNLKTSLVPRKIILLFEIIATVDVFAFILGLNLGSHVWGVVNFVGNLLLDLLIVYIEFVIRIPIRSIPVGSIAPQTVEEAKPLDVPVAAENNATKKESLFNDPEIWMDPNMTSAALARRVGTNKTYLLQRIKEAGFVGYNEMINSQRINYICEQINAHKDEENFSIIQVMYDAGFRSRSTASAEFKRYVGCSPSEYIKSL